MKFKFNVKMSEQDYLEYNKFWIMKSHYGKGQIASLRISMAVVFLVIVLFSCIGGGFTVDTLIGFIPGLILLLIAQAFVPKIFTISLKGQIITLKKKGKLAYSPESVMEFYDDSFIETTPDNKTEHNYSAIERISVVEDKIIYIHVNNVMSYFIPKCSFASCEEYDDFLEFIKTKCEKIQYY